ncbi:uncharacterized protein LOC133844784 [Drosophila sulfurigaster albostrigata]|uniref:uncharacterized protein LOC133844784 n=1 Tax=Drosophila sulfurigaster albostrigata TaxID=89887 RepID=UPI002D21BD93|nr:uncharacterized protein LOC133844784 [Drosophila sulfurigaster albostrigata]
MLVSPHLTGGGRNNIHLIACWFLLILSPLVMQTNASKNCTFIDGHILEFVCHGFYNRDLRLQFKDRIPAIDAPYAIWQRADYFASSMLLIVFYEGPLSNCYNLVFEDGKFYCDGRNYAMDVENSILVNCMPFPFSYSDELHKSCKRKRKSHSAETVSSVIIYMESNIYENSRTTRSQHCSYLYFCISTLLIVFHICLY